MATRLRPEAERLYDEDFYVWTERQAELLRARRFEDLDLDNLIEAVEALGRAERSRVLSNARIVIEHLLKLQYSPSLAPRDGWRATVGEHRSRLEVDLTPRLRLILTEELIASGAPPGVNVIGLGMVGPALMHHGTPEQKRRWIPPKVASASARVATFDTRARSSAKVSRFRHVPSLRRSS